jgi:predicted DNA-binding protein (MmcQ/YjbR family)
MSSSRKPSTHPVRPVARKDAAAVGKLRALCLSFPEANERRSHGEPTWFAGKGKVFAMLDNHHHGARHLAVWLPMPPGVQESLVSADPQRCFRPPYVGPAGWVGVVLDGGTSWDLVSKLLREAFLHVAGARLQAKLVPSLDARAAAAGRRTPAPSAAPRAGSALRGG